MRPRLRTWGFVQIKQLNQPLGHTLPLSAAITIKVIVDFQDSCFRGVEFSEACMIEQVKADCLQRGRPTSRAECGL